ncbi:MAG: porin family protein [Candidatus Cryptobacteroides sp.]
MEINDIFDSVFKEKLSSASLKAPDSVWENVSGRLAQKHSRHAYAWWWSAAAGLCAAAAALTLILSGGAQGVENVGEEMMHRIQVLPSEGRELAYINEVFEGEVKALDMELRLREMPVMAEITENENPKDEGLKPKKNLKEEEQVPQTEQTWTDPFAAMMAEDQAEAKKHKVHKSGITLGGIIGANDSHQQSRSSAHPMWTSGYTYDGVNENSSSTYSVPVTVGLSYRQAIGQRFGVSVGVNWSLLNRYFNGSYNTVEGEVTHTLHYVGIPVNLYYNMVQTRNIQIYAYGGFSAEKCVSSKYYVRSTSNIPLISEKVNEAQFGLKLGVGGAFRLTDFLSLYFDPYLAYYIPGNQPKSLRTEYPTMISFEAGLRFNL